MRTPVILPGEERIADDRGNVTPAWRLLLLKLVRRKAAYVTLTGTAATDIAALRQALIDADLMERS